MEYLPFIFFVLFLIYVVGIFAWNIIQNRKTNKWLADAKAEAEHQEWVAKRWASMTQKQQDDERHYYSLMRNTPVEQRRTFITGNSLSKDIIGFDLLPK
ncbi:hypothetical protein [Psychrobacter sp. K31L]|uniref:hypothetical protein n=1 Tax=Psychrobacter sp. K31L TaxID=2820758 RepID=UPI001B336D0C|nr:hypothetical protein [Psychrobacter sp. K31L]MBP3945128.1 hypothetical protein [Psychrobacter sp. K31L]